MAKRNAAAYGFLAVVAVVVCLWQGFEHHRTRRAAQAALLNRALDISNTLGVVLRSQRFFGMVYQPRLESALKELTQSDELKSVALLYASGQVAAAAGEPLRIGGGSLVRTGVSWEGNRFTVVNPVDLGPSPTDGREPQPSIVIPEGAERGRFPGPRGPRDESREDRRPGPPPDAALEGPPPSPGPDGGFTQALPPPPPGAPLPGGPREGPGGPPPPEEAGPPGPDDDRRGSWRARRPPNGPPRFDRPRWLSEEEYRELVNRQGVHYFVLSLSTDAYRATVRRDLWIRVVTIAVALVAATGLGLAWRNAARTAALEMNLLRADEMNRHLQEMNLAAAGLAHETKNPLNIIRGLAQLIAKREDAPGDVRETSWRIADEVDRVTDRVNQFLAYSRPPEARPEPTDLRRVVDDVARALETDREDKGIEFELVGPELRVEADEALLRQIVFNLLLNAIQALPEGGRVAVEIHEEPDGTVRMEVRDNGPGVPDSVREHIFRPYFTTSKTGTGLGLAVVQHAVHAHHWDIACLPANGGGAVFRLSRIRKVVS